MHKQTMKNHREAQDVPQISFDEIFESEIKGMSRERKTDVHLHKQSLTGGGVGELATSLLFG